MKTVKVYAPIGTVRRKCDYDVHTLQVVSVKTLTLTDETYVWDNGYQRTLEPIYKDAQGRRYKKQVTIDYHGNTFYWCEEASLLFRPLPYNGLRNSITYDKV